MLDTQHHHTNTAFGKAQSCITSKCNDLEEEQLHCSYGPFHVTYVVFGECWQTVFNQVVDQWEACHVPLSNNMLPVYVGEVCVTGRDEIRNLQVAISPCTHVSPSSLYEQSCCVVSRRKT